MEENRPTLGRCTLWEFKSKTRGHGQGRGRGLSLFFKDYCFRVRVTVMLGLSLMLQRQRHLNLGACAGFALANCDWLGRTIAFYQVFFQQGRVALGKWCIGPQKGHPGFRDGFFLYCAQASFSWPRVDLARLDGISCLLPCILLLYIEWFSFIKDNDN